MPFVVFICIALCGCGGYIPGGAPKESSRQDSIIIPETIFYSIKGHLSGDTLRFGMLGGTYKATKENDAGVFYKGQGYPIFSGDWDSQPVQITFLAGGIFVPNDQAQPPQFYYYFGESRVGTESDLQDPKVIPDDQISANSPSRLDTTPYAANAVAHGAPIAPAAFGSALGGAIVGAIIASGAGEIHMAIFPPPDAAFVQNIRQGLHRAPILSSSSTP